MGDSQRRSPPRWVRQVNSFNMFLGREVLGGRKLPKTSWVINTHKVLTPFVVIGLMIVYRNFSPLAWLYLGLHGSFVYAGW